jgi:hypothetical protein
MIWIFVGIVKIIFGSNCVPLFVTGTSKILSKLGKLLIINFWIIRLPFIDQCCFSLNLIKILFSLHPSLK